jgi:hypothetical protein
MANTIRIKRRAAGGASGAPSSLQNAELAFNEQDYTLYYGYGTGGAGGSATTIIPIGGSGAYVSLVSDQSISGIKTWTGSNDFTGSTVTVATSATSDNSSSVASTAFVKAQGYLTALTGVTSVGLSLPSIFSVSSSPVTTTGTLTATLNTQLTAQVFAAPADADGQPVFRALVPTDIPTLTAVKISDFNTQVRTNRLDQLAVPTATLNFNNVLVTNLANPVSAQDAATKAYVDNLSQGLDVKSAVRATTSSNITLSGEQVVDGVSLVTGDRVLVKDQTNSAENGIYIVAAGTWTRSLDADTDEEVKNGLFVFVEEGLTFSNSGWTLTTPNPITLGTTGLTFSKFSSAGEVNAGAGLTKTGSTIDLVSADNSRIAVDANSIDLATTGVTAGSYTKVTVDNYGRVTLGSNPTTLSGYGITDAQPLDAGLTSIAGLTTSADQFLYLTAADTYATASITSYARTLLDDVDATSARATLELGNLATQSSNNVNITGGTISGVSTDGLTMDGGTF